MSNRRWGEGPGERVSQATDLLTRTLSSLQTDSDAKCDKPNRETESVQLHPCAVPCSFSRVRLSETPRTVARQGPLSMGFSRRESRSGLPFPSPGHLPHPGLLHCRQILYHLSHQGSRKDSEVTEHASGHRNQKRAGEGACHKRGVKWNLVITSFVANQG